MLGLECRIWGRCCARGWVALHFLTPPRPGFLVSPIPENRSLTPPGPLARLSVSRATFADEGYAEEPILPLTSVPGTLAAWLRAMAGSCDDALLLATPYFADDALFPLLWRKIAETHFIQALNIAT